MNVGKMSLRKSYKRWRLKRDVATAKRIIKKIDRQLHAFPRWQRKQFWRDFQRSEEFRETMIDHTIVGKK
jgi:hypothetical protein